MVFCTNCGNKLAEEHRFCSKCGTALDPSTEHEDVHNIPDHNPSPNLDDSAIDDDFEIPNTSSSVITGSDETQIQEKSYEYRSNEPYSYAIDRKTLFSDGLLVLSSQDLILYSSDERDELKRIPLSSIESASFNMLWKNLEVKRRINEEDNFVRYVESRKNKLAQLNDEFANQNFKLRNTRVRNERAIIKNKMAGIYNEIQTVSEEVRQLDTDPTKIHFRKRKEADIKKETFKLPKDFSSDHDIKSEYKIWAYAINRRISRIPKMKIETCPYSAIVKINGQVIGTTPLVTELPLFDEAVLNGKYDIEVLKEDYEKEHFQISTKLGKDSFLKQIELKKLDKHDVTFDEYVQSLRGKLPDRSIDLTSYSTEREIDGIGEILVLTRETLLVLSKDRQEYLFEIPYGSVNEAKYDDRFLRGNKAIRINYNERGFGEQFFEFWIDDKNGEVSKSEIKHRSESLVELLNRKRKECDLTDYPKLVRAQKYFVITPNDLQNNFQRFEPFEFERLVGKLFEKKGYKVEVTKKTGDLGVDLLARAANDTIAIQVKHWQASVGGPDVHKTLGSMFTYGANRAMVVTTSDFTKQAYEIQKRGAPVDLWNGAKLREEFRRHLLDAINYSREKGS
ncbi:MAG: restriction endonuclease [Thaumarchaeota archaeon]|nr:restriction endonuclease [Nitrososphaerota archaeon]